MTALYENVGSGKSKQIKELLLMLKENLDTRKSRYELTISKFKFEIRRIRNPQNRKDLEQPSDRNGDRLTSN